ncbi:hypothetical protein IWQ60_010270 [Tieghemiomyces parasiticus]|uniref:Peptidase S8/S53 domain-containing protein n=1 Tax=Tieghemiomyces parasiticus TaxID=78921 RepID=A0A9W8DJV2_9FUNG|nr:hypothetical protein IWQ60_010270 [Tieghemiomyces parasiticus]
MVLHLVGTTLAVLATVVTLQVHASYITNSFMVEFPGYAPNTELAAWYRRALADELVTHAVPFAFRANFSSVILASQLHLPSKYQGFVSGLAVVQSFIRDVRLTSQSIQVTQISANKTLSLNMHANTVTGSFAAGDVATASIRANKPPPLLTMEMTNYDMFQRKYPNITGRGIRVRVVDSGLDYRHPAFGNCFGRPNCRVRFGSDFIGDTMPVDGSPIPDDGDPLDTCFGHGTSVAGILAGNDGPFQGVAPQATLGIYRVLDCHDNTSVPIVTAALEQAQRDGMQVINLSVGSPSGFSFDLQASLGSALARAGIAVVSAAGNSGSDSLFMNNSPATGISVV